MLQVGLSTGFVKIDKAMSENFSDQRKVHSNLKRNKNKRKTPPPETGSNTLFESQEQSRSTIKQSSFTLITDQPMQQPNPSMRKSKPFVLSSEESET